MAKNVLRCALHFVTGAFYNQDMSYIERIKALRKEKKKRQREVAEQIFVSQRTYSDYESGRIRLPVDSLVRLAKYYDVSVDYISGAVPEKGSFPKEGS